MRDVSNDELNNGIANHIWTVTRGTHKIALDKVELIEMELFSRKFKEALHIGCHQGPLMNQDRGTKINPIWSSALFPVYNQILQSQLIIFILFDPQKSFEY